MRTGTSTPLDLAEDTLIEMGYLQVPQIHRRSQTSLGETSHFSTTGLLTHDSTLNLRTHSSLSTTSRSRSTGSATFLSQASNSKFFLPSVNPSQTETTSPYSPGSPSMYQTSLTPPATSHLPLLSHVSHGDAISPPIAHITPSSIPVVFRTTQTTPPSPSRFSPTMDSSETLSPGWIPPSRRMKERARLRARRGQGRRRQELGEAAAPATNWWRTDRRGQYEGPLEQGERDTADAVAWDVNRVKEKEERENLASIAESMAELSLFETQMKRAETVQNTVANQLTRPDAGG